MNLEPGDEFTAEVEKIRPNGTCTVKYDGEGINIGPVTCEPGRSVRLRYLGENTVVGTTIRFALCLTDEVLADGYDDHIRRHVSGLLPDRPPQEGEQTYIEIDKVDEYGFGLAVAGDEVVELGPVQAEEGDLVQVVGREPGYAEVVNSRARGKRYKKRFDILRERWENLPLEKGKSFTTTIDDTDGSNLIAYVNGMPVYFPNGSAQIAQKIEGKLIGSNRGRGIGQLTKIYNTVGNIEDPEHDTRMQQLRQAGIGEQPFRAFARRFTGASDEQLPSTETEIRDALIGEAIRLAIAEKAESGDQKYPQAHITAIRHWVVHKLAAILGEPAEDDSTPNDEGWFQTALIKRTGPTITFLGDVMRLSQGYYAPAPTRAVMISETEAVLVSGDPSRAFLDSGLNLEFRGLTRVLTETSEKELQSSGIPIQSKDEYIGLGEAPITTPATLREYIDQRPQEPWEPEEDWAPYTGQYYGFRADGDPLVIEKADGTVISMWRVPVEYGADTYQLKVQTGHDEPPMAVAVSPRYRKHACLILDSMAEDPQSVELTAYDEGVLVSCDFAPPRAQMRWLYAVGAEWLETSSYQLQWRISDADAESVQEVFDELPVTIIDNT